MKANQKYEISVLNALFCLLVVFIHCSGGPKTQLIYKSVPYFSLLIPWRLSAFVVQGFILLSAVKLFMREQDRPYIPFIWGRIKRVYLPYVFWAVAYYGAFCALGVQKFSFSYLIKNIFTGNIAGHFYFVIIIMQFYLLFPLWKKIIKKENAGIMIPASILISVIFEKALIPVLQIALPNKTFMYNDRLFTTYIAYWVMGCYIGIYYESFKKMLLSNKLFITVFFTVTAISDVYLTYLAESGLYQMQYLSDIHFIYCIFALLFTYMLALSIKSEGFLNSRVLRSFDKISYTVYLCHCLVLFGAEGIISRLSVQSVGIKFLLSIAIVYPLSIITGLIISYIKGFFKPKKSKPHGNKTTSEKTPMPVG